MFDPVEEDEDEDFGVIVAKKKATVMPGFLDNDSDDDDDFKPKVLDKKAAPTKKSTLFAGDSDEEGWEKVDKSVKAP